MSKRQKGLEQLELIELSCTGCKKSHPPCEWSDCLCECWDEFICFPYICFIQT